jgi:putative two-component system response regulator
MTVSADNRRILLVDDSQGIHANFRDILGGAHDKRAQLCDSKLVGSDDASEPSLLPMFEIDSAFSGEEAIELVKSKEGRTPYAVAFVDVQIPSALDGVQTTKLLLELDSELQIVICGSQSDYSLTDILREFGHTGRVMLYRKPFDAVETCLLAVSLTDKWRLTHEMNQRFQQQSDQISDTRRVMSIIEDCLDEREHAHDELRLHSIQLTDRLAERETEIVGTRDLAMFALAQLADSRDPETGEHLLRMRAYAQLLANELSTNGPYMDQVDRAFLADFYRSTPLHDIGKVGIPDQILLKPGPLTKEEFDVMKRHTIIGAEALERAAAQSSFGGFLKRAALIARSHHERFDGKGYPDELCGTEIPLSARITAVADVFDALTSARVYKDAMPAEEARQLILNETGKHFDPVVIDAFLVRYDDFLKVKETIDGGEVDPATPLVCFDEPLPLFETPAIMQ